MEKDCKVIVRPADNWASYLKAWTLAMEGLYWFQKNPIFDFNKDEEIDEMGLDFKKTGHLFLTACKEDDEDIIGVLALRYDDLIGRIRRWEPAVHPKFRTARIAEALLTRALELLDSMGVRRVNCLFKYPVTSPEIIATYLDLYKNAGFERSRPDSVDLVMSLDSINNVSGQSHDVHVVTGENYTFEELANIIVKSFTSTPEEREIHGFDRTVTEHVQATALLQRMAEGFYGLSPTEFRKIAIVDNNSAGFLGAFISESRYKPRTGVLGPMAVLPEYRRRGIGLTLIAAVLQTLREFGCKYAAVGTPAANLGAIQMYEKAGFKLNCRIINLEKEL